MGHNGIQIVSDREKRVLAMVLHGSFDRPGVNFLTPNEFSQQLGYLHHPAGKLIQPHVHNPAPRQVAYTQEVLFIKKGRVRVDFYSAAQVYLESTVLVPGDVVLLIEGGHGFECLEETIMIEVKQGPYVGEHDKTRFSGIQSHEAKIGGSE